MKLFDFIGRLFSKEPPPAAPGVFRNPTHEGLVKAMGLRFEASRRVPDRRTYGPPIGFAPHRAPPRNGVRRITQVPVYYAPHVTRNRFSGKALVAFQQRQGAAA